VDRSALIPLRDLLPSFGREKAEATSAFAHSRSEWAKVVMLANLRDPQSRKQWPDESPFCRHHPRPAPDQLACGGGRLSGGRAGGAVARKSLAEFSQAGALERYTPGWTRRNVKELRHSTMLEHVVAGKALTFCRNMLYNRSPTANPADR